VKHQWCPRCKIFLSAEDITVEGDGNYVDFYSCHEECGTEVEMKEE
jgi:hypothetical protein